MYISQLICTLIVKAKFIYWVYMFYNLHLNLMYLFFRHVPQLVASWFPDPGLNPGPWQ